MADAMRALLAAGLALLLVLVAAAPHGHAGAADSQGCAACVVRHGDAARDETPDVAPVAVAAAAPAIDAGLAPVFGAPLGAIPGQSPPATA